MRRREFVKALAAGSVGAATLHAKAPSSTQAGPSARFLLSSHGCGRATGYAEANKIVTVGDKTHVAWLDSVKEGFRVRVRTLDRKAGAWSPTVTVGEAFDNHGGPALTVDGKGYLHIVCYPHHHPFRHRRSTRPNDASAWDKEVRFGERCTYPTLVCGPDDTLYLTCRESNAKTRPWVVNLYTKRPGGPWQGPTTILRADEGGYAHFQEALAWGPDRRTLHLSTRMYGGKPGRAHTVGYMRSPDGGKTWQRPDGRPIELPAASDTLSVIDQDRKGKSVYRCGAIAVDAKGVPHVLYSNASAKPSHAWIATPAGGSWRRRALHDDIARALGDWSAAMPGGIAIAGGRIFATLTAVPNKAVGRPGYSGWGDPRWEVIRLESNDGGKPFSVERVSKPDPGCAHWLPNIERPTGHNVVTRPSLIYTAGGPGKRNTDIVSNCVWWVA